MASDDERFEQRLRRLKPAEPPTALRRRVLMSAPPKDPSSSWRLWLAAAAVIVFAVWLQWQATSSYATLAAPELRLQQEKRDEQIAMTAEAWGGSSAAYSAAMAAIDALESVSSAEDLNRPTPGERGR